MAKLYFRYGAMNCGKTALLLQAVHNYEDRGMKILILKPESDTKGGNRVVSRIGLERDVDHIVGKDENLLEYLDDKLEDVKCIFVDESQFLKREQVDDLMQVTVKHNIPVICYGLRTDFLTNGFPGSTRLLEIAHTNEELKTICKCGAKATYNARFVNGVPVFEGEQVAIDGEDLVTYDSMCPKCYYDSRRKFNENKAKVYIKK